MGCRKAKLNPIKIRKNEPPRNEEKKNETFLKRVCSLSPSDIKNIVFKVAECFYETASTAQRKLLFILFFWGRYQMNVTHAITEVIQSHLPTCSS